MQKQMNLLFPQWQGGGPDRSTYYGALELKKRYLGTAALETVEVKTADGSAAPAGKGIFAYNDILKQMGAARALLDKINPDRIFTIGGGCDAGLLPLSYLNNRTGGELTIIWFDAHGDLNTPQSSPSGFFYGMPLRSLLGEGDPAILNLQYSLLKKDRLILVGVRDLDQAEQKYIERHTLTLIETDTLEKEPATLLEAVKNRGRNNIYIHLDLDVLDPAAFPRVAVPTPCGLSIKTLEKLLVGLHDQFNLIGLGLFEYSATTEDKSCPGDQEANELLQTVFQIGKTLAAN